MITTKREGALFVIGWITFFILFYYYIKDNSKEDNSKEEDNKKIEHAFLGLCLLFQLLSASPSLFTYAPLLSSSAALIVATYYLTTYQNQNQNQNQNQQEKGKELSWPYITCLIISVLLFIPRGKTLLIMKKEE
jgi:heme/copper-type cytochrome/quinol oxidase subunit 2